jgi:hypothetical protein
MDRFVVDFCCADAKVIVELDGGQHDERRPVDADRTSILETMGYLVLLLEPRRAQQYRWCARRHSEYGGSTAIRTPSPQPSPRRRGEGVGRARGSASGAQQGATS